jgi:prophage maintenance system killer protein
VPPEILTDFSNIGAEDIKDENRFYLEDPEQVYDTRLPNSLVKQRISSTRNGDLRDVMRRVPQEDVTVVEQCSYWIQGFISKHFFPDANHRTAFNTLSVLLNHNDLRPSGFFEYAIEDTVSISKTARKRIDPVSVDENKKDTLYAVWHWHFEKVFNNETQR